MNRKIGFVGCYSHDVILMLAIVLCYMKKKVLIRDRNRQQTLQASIPIPDGLCAAKTIVEYNGFFFTGQESDVEEKEKFDIEIIVQHFVVLLQNIADNRYLDLFR